MPFIYGILAMSIFLLFIYALGIIPNLWTGHIIHHSNVEGVLRRGLSVFFLLSIVVALIAVIYWFGVGLSINLI